MPTTWNSLAKAALAASFLTAAFVAGAETQAQLNVARLNQAHDFQTKTRALLDTVQGRPSYGSVEAAKTKIDGAMKDIETAVKQNGG